MSWCKSTTCSHTSALPRIRRPLSLQIPKATLATIKPTRAKSGKSQLPIASQIQGAGMLQRKENAECEDAATYVAAGH